MPVNDHYVIIGNGPAGNTAAATLRNRDKDASITIISHETIPFYYKPRLTRYILGELEKSDLIAEPAASAGEKNIRLRLGQKVDRIDADKQMVFLHHMEAVHYTKLIIATGSGARVLPSMNSYARYLNHITGYDQVVALRKKIQDAQKFFIFGGDLVGFKFVKMLKKMGKQVSLLIYPNAFWPFNLTPDMEETIAARLEGHGVHVLVQDDILDITLEEKGYQVATIRGEKKEADLVFSFNGLVPYVDFAMGSGLDIDHGILVNENMGTNNKNIYACGSCAQIYNPKINTYTTSIGWPNALVQGEVAALNLLGEHKVISSAGRKYFDLEGIKVKTTWWEDIENL